jgi:hypothetical protein
MLPYFFDLNFFDVPGAYAGCRVEMREKHPFTKFHYIMVAVLWLLQSSISPAGTSIKLIIPQLFTLN